MRRPACKVLSEARQVQGALEDVSQGMRRLRLALLQCDHCPEKDCPLVREISAQINTALAELTTEWSL